MDYCIALNVNGAGGVHFKSVIPRYIYAHSVADFASNELKVGVGLFTGKI